MLLNNFYRILVGAWTAVKPGLEVKAMDGSVMNVSGAALDGLTGYMMSYSYPGSPTAKIVVVFGTGNTAPALEDYQLSGELVTQASLSSTSNQGTSTTRISRVYKVTNSGTEDLTIGEVGIRYMLNGNYVLIERTALDTPVTIAPGGVGYITYTLDFSLPGGAEALTAAE